MNKNVITKAYEILEPTEEQKERILNNILKQKTNEVTKSLKPIKRFRPAIAAAIIVFCLLTTTAFAVFHFGLDAKFLNFLNISNPEQTEYLVNGAYIVNEKIQNKNGTLEIKHVLGDSNLTYILFDFTAPEGVVLDADRYDFGYSLESVSNYQGHFGYGFEKLEDENPDDNKISMVMILKAEHSLMGETIRLKFEDLKGAPKLPKTFEEADGHDSEEFAFKTVVEGTWVTSFKLDFKDYSTTYTPDSKVTVHGYEATLKSIAISPISVTVKFQSPFLDEIYEAAPDELVEYNTYPDKFPVTINYKDGSQEITTYETGMTLGKYTVDDYTSDEVISVKRFESIINDKEIESIEFFDIIIPVN